MSAGDCAPIEYLPARICLFPNKNYGGGNKLGNIPFSPPSVSDLLPRFTPLVSLGVAKFGAYPEIVHFDKQSNLGDLFLKPAYLFICLGTYLLFVLALRFPFKKYK